MGCTLHADRDQRIGVEPTDSGVAVLSDRCRVQVPFLFGIDDAGVTTSETPVLGEHLPVGSAAAERLWDELYLARAGTTGQPVADLEDAVFRLYLPMARTLAHSVAGDSAVERGYRPPNSAWRTPSWPGDSGRAVDSGGSPGPRSCGNSSTNDIDLSERAHERETGVNLAPLEPGWAEKSLFWPLQTATNRDGPARIGKGPQMTFGAHQQAGTGRYPVSDVNGRPPAGLDDFGGETSFTVVREGCAIGWSASAAGSAELSGSSSRILAWPARTSGTGRSVTPGTAFSPNLPACSEAGGTGGVKRPSVSASEGCCAANPYC